MRRLIIPIALATSLIAAGSLAGAAADPGPGARATAGLRAVHQTTETTADQTASPKAGRAIDWTSVAPSDEPVTADDVGGGTDDSMPPPPPATPRLVTVIGHGTTVTAALDDAAATAKQIAHHEDLELGDIQSITQDPGVPPAVSPPTTTTTDATPTTPTTGLPAPGDPPTADETVTVAYAIE